MAAPTNLNQFRKSRARIEKTVRGDENAIKFGRSKHEKELEEARATKAARALDGHKPTP